MQVLNALSGDVTSLVPVAASYSGDGAMMLPLPESTASSGWANVDDASQV